MSEKTYVCIDLKSFYASVECRERGLDPMTTNLVVADSSRTVKTICLAVSPSLKAIGLPGRARLFEVVQKVSDVNAERLRQLPGHKFLGKSCSAVDLGRHPELELDYVIAPPRMAHYIKYSTEIYAVYLKYVAPEDIHVYSIDEVFIDVTGYLQTMNLSAHEFARIMIRDVLASTGITATAGIGSNMYLAKIAMDIVAKHIPADRDGVRIAELDELKYRQLLWDHRPLTDFWRVGRGYVKKLEANGLYTMGDIARCSISKSPYYNEELLYKLFGVNAELLIDHAWGWEPCTIKDVKAYRPTSNSLGSGQVLQDPYTAVKARLVIREMADALALDLVDKGLAADQAVLTVGYDIENLKDPARSANYHGPVTKDAYGRRVPKHAHGTVNLSAHTSSSKEITTAVLSLYDRIVDETLLIRRLNLVVCHVIPEIEVARTGDSEQLSLFENPESRRQEEAQEEKLLARERRRQEAILAIKKKYGKNAILKAMDLEDGATAILRNNQIGGHKA